MISDPTSFSSDLTHDRLNVIACLLLDARYKALHDANTELDDRYTKGASPSDVNARRSSKPGAINCIRGSLSHMPALT
ncbi:MAG: hypothetical protein ACXWT4_14980 [Methylobacter sp.]